MPPTKAKTAKKAPVLKALTWCAAAAAARTPRPKANVQNIDVPDTFEATKALIGNLIGILYAKLGDLYIPNGEAVGYIENRLSRFRSAVEDYIAGTPHIMLLELCHSWLSVFPELIRGRTFRYSEAAYIHRTSKALEDAVNKLSAFPPAK